MHTHEDLESWDMELYFAALILHGILYMAVFFYALLMTVRHAIRKSLARFIWSLAILLASVISFYFFNMPPNNFVDPGLTPIVFQLIGAAVAVGLGITLWKILKTW